MYFNLFYGFRGNMGEVGFLGEVSADEADGVFDGALFPAMKGFTEEGLGSQSGVCDQMIRIFRSVVVGEGEAESLGISAKSSLKRIGNVLGAFLGDTSDLGIAGFAFQGSDQGDKALMVADGIDFPMARFFSGVDGLGAVLDRDSLGDMQFFMPAVMSFAPAFPVMAGQKRDQFSGLGIDPLVDGFRADGRGDFLLLPASGDLFGRPAFLKLFPDILAQGIVFQSGPNTGFPPPEFSPLLSPVRKIIPGFNRRGIAFEFAGYGAGVTTQGSGNFS